MKKLLLSSAMILSASVAQAAENHDHHNHGVAADKAPAGVTGSHIHSKGDWMFSYSVMRMNMHGNRHSDSKVDVSDVYGAGYAIAPLDMTTTSHMFGGMYGVTDRVTAMVMLPYIEKEMNLRTSTGTNFSTRSRGWGDTKISALYDPENPKLDNFIFGMGVSLPTGATDRRHATPAGAETKLPYPMQLGSGSYELLPSVTYQCDCRDGVFYGAQAKAQIRLNDAQEGYTLGDRYTASAWAGKAWNSELSNTIRIEWDEMTNGEGSDPDLNPNAIPTADADMQARTRINLGLGMNYAPEWAQGHQLLLEAKTPLYEKIDGYGLEMDTSLMLTWRKSF